MFLAGAAQDGSRGEGDETVGDRLIRATKVTLDFQDKSVGEVASAIGKRSGRRIQNFEYAATKRMLAPPNRDANKRRRRVTLKAAEPVRFWEAVDWLCEAGRIGFRLAEFGETGSATSGLVFEGPSKRASGLIQYEGPFRVALTGIHEHRDVMFVQGPWVRVYANMTGPINAADLKSAPLDGGPLYAELQLMAEPGLICRRDGPLSGLDATDNQGGSLLSASAEELMSRSDPYADFVWGTSAPLRIPLKRPDCSSQTIHQLRGSIPVEIAVFGTNPLWSSPCKGRRGRSFKGLGPHSRSRPSRPASTAR